MRCSIWIFLDKHIMLWSVYWSLTLKWYHYLEQLSQRSAWVYKTNQVKQSVEVQKCLMTFKMLNKFFKSILLAQKAEANLFMWRLTTTYPPSVFTSDCSKVKSDTQSGRSCQSSGKGRGRGSRKAPIHSAGHTTPPLLQIHWKGQGPPQR